jgi:hypothetical protein
LSDNSISAKDENTQKNTSSSIKEDDWKRMELISKGFETKLETRPKINNVKMRRLKTTPQ